MLRNPQDGAPGIWSGRRLATSGFIGVVVLADPSSDPHSNVGFLSQTSRRHEWEAFE